MRQAAGFSFAQKKAPSAGQVGCFCGWCVFVSFKRNEFARSSPCDGRSIRAVLAVRMFELPSTATADSDYPTKPEATKANAKTAPLAAVVQTAGRQTWVANRDDLSSKYGHSFSRIMTRILSLIDSGARFPQPPAFDRVLSRAASDLNPGAVSSSGRPDRRENPTPMAVWQPTNRPGKADGGRPFKLPLAGASSTITIHQLRTGARSGR
jgi:hypothetical protein